MFTDDDTRFMQTAIEASAIAVQAGDMPFGAVLVSPEGKGLLVARNNQNTAADCTGHAEMVLVREAARRLGPASLHGATVYASGEPCAMCSGALFWARVRRVVYAASSQDIVTALGEPMLPIDSATVLAAARPVVTVEGPLLGPQAVQVLRDFAGGAGK